MQRQREIVTEMWERGASTDMAVALLEQFQDTLRLHKAHLVRIEARDDADSTYTAPAPTTAILRRAFAALNSDRRPCTNVTRSKLQK